MEAGAAEVHFRIASPPTQWPCFYGVDTPDRDKLLAATMTEEEMRAYVGVDSLKFVSLDGLYRACERARRRNARQPQFCDACFSGDYPVRPSDRIDQGFRLKVSAMTDAAPARVALVTGASRGLGYAVARALGARGAQVIAMARTVGGLEDLADAIEAAGGPTPTLVPLSITDEGGLQRLCLAHPTSAGAGSTSPSTAPPTPPRWRRRPISATRTST